MGRRSRSRARNWIQRAVKNPGALKAWAKRYRKKIKDETGMDPFTKSGELNTNVLKSLRNTKWYQSLSSTTKRRINFAITAEKFHRG